jgi:hypothetical protein
MFLQEKFRGPIYEVIMIFRERAAGTTKTNTSFAPPQFEFIIQTHLLHEGFESMIAVGPTPGNLKRQVNFSRGLEREPILLHLARSVGANSG